MKQIKYLGRSFILICLLFTFACGDNEECPEGYSGSNCDIYCSQDILGTWAVTEITPVGCTLITYEFGLGSTDKILSISLDDGNRTFNGDGLLNNDCTEMTYTVSSGGTIVSGTILFDDNTLEDRSGLGCLIYATKQ